MRLHWLVDNCRNSHYLKLKRPEKYELIGDYEKQTEEDVALWDKKLDNMIASTKVIEVVNRYCILPAFLLYVI